MYLCKFVIILVLTSYIQGWTYYQRDHEPDLVSMPHDIPLTISAVYIFNTGITEIDYVELFNNIYEFGVYDSELIHFPDLANISHTVVFCYFWGNNIEQIPVEFVDTMTTMEYLQLEKNKLTEFPDASAQRSLKVLNLTENNFIKFPYLPNWGKTLQKLDLDYNQITFIEPNKLAVLTELQDLLLAGNHLSSFPDLRQLSPSNIQEVRLMSNRIDARTIALNDLSLFSNLVVDLRNNNMNLNHLPNPFVSVSLTRLYFRLTDNILECDVSAKWLNLAKTSGHLTTDDILCSGPTELSGHSLHLLTMDKLHDIEDGVIAATASRMAPGTVLQIQIGYGVIHGNTGAECAARCLLSNKCIAFGYDTNDCYVTNQDDQTVGVWDIGMDIKWYTL